MTAPILKLLLYLLIILLASCGQDIAPEEVKPGNKAPGFSLKSLDGTTVTSRSYDQDIVILNFWATYCAPCQKEIPELQEVAATTDAKVIGIALDQDGLQKIKTYVKRKNVTYTILLGNEKVFRRYNGFSIPYTLVLNRQQQIFKVYRGPTTKEELKRDLQKINQGTI